MQLILSVMIFSAAVLIGNTKYREIIIINKNRN